MATVRIADDRIFSHDVHGPDLAFLCGIHQLDQRLARLFRQSRPPGQLELLSQIGIGHRLVGWQEIGQGTHIAGALHIVLATQGIDARGGLSKVAGHHGQIGQGEDVIHTMRVLSDAHGIDYGGRIPPGIEPGSISDQLGLDTRNACRVRWGQLQERGFELREALRPLRDEALIHQLLFQDYAAHLQNEGHIRSRGLAQPDVGDLAQVDPAGIGHDDPGPLPFRLFDLEGDDGMLLAGVRTDDEDASSVC